MTGAILPPPLSLPVQPEGCLHRFRRRSDRLDANMALDIKYRLSHRHALHLHGAGEPLSTHAPPYVDSPRPCGPQPPRSQCPADKGPIPFSAPSASSGPFAVDPCVCRRFQEIRARGQGHRSSGSISVQSCWLRLGHAARAVCCLVLSSAASASLTPPDVGDLPGRGRS